MVAWKRVVPCVLLGVASVASQALAGAPEGWFRAGSRPNSYEVGTDSDVVKQGKSSAYIKSVDAKVEGFGTLMQVIAADDYRGKRVRLTGYVKSESVVPWGGLWMRVDGKDRSSLAFDNMQGRPIEGTTDWTKYDVVLDVAEEAEKIAFGFLLSGTGQMWVDGIDLGVVGTDVPVTDVYGTTPKKPANLDFEKPR